MDNTELYKITIKQYQEICDIDESLSIVEQNIYAVAALKDITYEEASKIQMSEFKKLVDIVADFNVKLLEKLKINNKITLGDNKYYIEHRPDKLTSGQLLDIINVRSSNAGQAVKAMHLILAAMSRPKGKKYGEDNLTLIERAELFKGVNLKDVWNVFVFFWNLWSDYLRSTEDSLQVWMEESIQKAKKILANDGDSLA